MMKSRRRITSVYVLGVLGTLGLLAVAGCGPSATSEAIASFDPAEVQYLRDNAEENDAQIDDELLLSTLKFREGCRIIGRSLAGLSAGASADAVAEGLGAVVDLARSDNQDELADSYVEMIDALRLGDSSGLLAFHTATCGDVS